MNEEMSESEKKYYEWYDISNLSQGKLETKAEELCDMTEVDFWNLFTEINRGRLAVYKKELVNQKLKELEQDFE